MKFVKNAVPSFDKQGVTVCELVLSFEMTKGVQYRPYYHLKGYDNMSNNKHHF